MVQHNQNLSLLGNNLIDVGQINYSTTSLINKDFISVKDYGAIGDGTTDDTAEIQAAMDAAGAAGKGIYFPAGSAYYKISDELVLNYSGMRIYGEAWNGEAYAKSRIVQTATDKPAFRVAIPGGGQVSTHNIIFDSLRIVGPGGELSTAAGIDFYLDGPLGTIFSDFNTIRNCQIRGWRQGIRASKFANSSIIGCSLYGNYNNIEIGGNSNSILIQNTQNNSPINIGFKSLGAGNVTFLTCEWGNGPKMMDIGQDGAIGMTVTMIDNVIESVSGSPPDESPSVAFHVRNSNSLHVRGHFRILDGTATSTVPVFRFDQGALGSLENANMIGFDAATPLCQQYINNPIPVRYTQRTATFRPINIYSDSGFSTLVYTMRCADFDFYNSAGIPAAASTNRGRIWIQTNESGADQILASLHAGGSVYEKVSLTPTKSISTWGFAQTFQGDVIFDHGSGNAALKLTEGVNRRAGVATLSSGTVTVSTARVTANSRIHFSRQSPNASTAIGSIACGTLIAGTSFVINSLKSDATVETGDQSSVFWWITEPN